MENQAARFGLNEDSDSLANRSLTPGQNMPVLQHMAMSGGATSVPAPDASYNIEYSLKSEQVRKFEFILSLTVPAIWLTMFFWLLFSSGIVASLQFELPLVAAIVLSIAVVGALPWLTMKTQRKYLIALDQHGLTFSNQWKHDLMGRLHREWSDLHSVQLVIPVGTKEEIEWADSPASKKKWYLPTSGTIFSSPRLVFDFKSGGSNYMLLNRLTSQQAETLFRGLEQWADPSTLSADVVRLEKAILLGQIPSFTEMWQDDLNGRYIATNYVPLNTNHVLQSGRYRVLLQLAAGGMSAVYLCVEEHGKKVVLKESVMPATADEGHREKAKELFAREARLLLALNHPQIAAVEDSFSEGGRDYLVLEHIPGQTLRQIVRKSGKVDEASALRWMRDLCAIVEYLHSREPAILHRDLSPDNIILREDGRVVLVDFGAANEYLGNATGTFIGKQCYMAPEQLRGRANTLSDIYSWGATLHFLLTGVDPTPLMPSRPKEIEKTITDRCNKLVMSCTSFEQEERPQSAAEVAFFLDSEVGAVVPVKR